MTHEKRSALVELIGANNIIASIEKELRTELENYAKKPTAHPAVVERYTSRIENLQKSSQIITIQILNIKAHFEDQQAQIAKLQKAFHSPEYTKVIDRYIDRIKETVFDKDRPETFENDIQ